MAAYIKIIASKALEVHARVGNSDIFIYRTTSGGIDHVTLIEDRQQRDYHCNINGKWVETLPSDPSYYRESEALPQDVQEKVDEVKKYQNAKRT